MREITDQRSGEIPDDLSAEASKARSKQMRTADCNSTDVPEAWTHPSFASVDERLARLSTIEGKDASFAKSLADQYAKKGVLSTKQLGWVGRLYRKYADQNYWRRFGALNHDWQRVGTITHHYNTVLHTYARTHYYKCTKCGEWGEEYDYKNYSGD
jgi:hypothetical protein